LWRTAFEFHPKFLPVVPFRVSTVIRNGIVRINI